MTTRNFLLQLIKAMYNYSIDVGVKLFCSLCLVLGSGQTFAKDWFISLDTGGFYDSNVTTAMFHRDTVEDEGGFASLSLQRDWAPTNLTLVTLSLLAETQQFETVDKLNTVTAGGEVSFGWQNRFGFLSPFYSISLGALRREADYDDNDADIYYGQFLVNRRVLDTITTRLGYRYEVAEAQSEVFDVKEHKLFFNMEYFWTQNLISYLTANIKTGDVVSSAQAVFCNGLTANDIYPLIAASESIGVNKALNSHFCGDWVSYRLKADTASVTLGFNYLWNSVLSFDLSAQMIGSRVDENINYERQIFRAGILVSF